jgi:hypothetical protein
MEIDSEYKLTASRPQAEKNWTCVSSVTARGGQTNEVASNKLKAATLDFLHAPLLGLMGRGWRAIRAYAGCVCDTTRAAASVGVDLFLLGINRPEISRVN